MVLGTDILNWGPTATPDCIAACAGILDPLGVACFLAGITRRIKFGTGD